MDKEEAQQKAHELVQLSLQAKELREQINDLKAELKDYADFENINNHVWYVDNGQIEILTEVKYKLADVPAEVKVDPDVAAVDIAQKAFKSKITLTKEGKRMFKEEYPSIVKLMIPNEKKRLKVII